MNGRHQTGLEHVFGQAAALGSRASQQDKLESLRFGDALVVALADGVGGRPSGARAAATAIAAAFEVIGQSKEHAPSAALLPAALEAADDAVAVLSDGRTETPGTTLLLAVFEPGRLSFVSVGDSHLVRLRAGEMHWLTSRQHLRVDLEVCALLSGDPRDWRRVAGLRHATALTGAIVGKRLFLGQVCAGAIQPEDIYLFATDGIECLSFDALMRAVPQLIAALDSPAAVAARIISGVSDRAMDGQDNATLGIVHCRKNYDASEAATTLLGSP